MPLKLSTLTAPTATVEMPYLGESLSITWRPMGLTPAQQDRMSSAVGDENESTKGLVEVLASLISTWDLLDEAGNPLPITVAQLMLLPKSFLIDVLAFLTASVAPKEASEPPSSDI